MPMILRDERWPQARLIPLPTGTGVEATIAASALLAVRVRSTRSADP